MASGATTKLTCEDFLKLPDDGKRYELIEGELYVNPAPNLRHQRIVANLHFGLRLYFEKHGGGEVFVAPVDVLFDDENACEPDLVVVTDARASILGEKNMRGAPDLVIEVLSESSRRADEITKRRIYERSGVAEYWIADPVLDLVKILRREDARFVRVAESSIETGGTITTPLLPEFALDVRSVFPG